jgi:glucokinase
VPPTGSGFGTFEWAAGGHAFARAGTEAAHARAGGRLRQLADGNAANVSASVVFAAAAEGDAEGLRIATQMADRLATGIAAAICVVNPELTVISGGISLAGAMLLELIGPRVPEIVPVMPKLVLSPLGEESVVLGAIEYAVELALDEALSDGRKERV